ncbi:hypothetical protein [Nocardia lijiangensis]|uniref:hypothetical protein n=1 Tax=Nocardia lijiangensis TaxID=299618 RepID=UPI0013903A12|nr:hypothetical protein [Nocardia lijiangensis]
MKLTANFMDLTALATGKHQNQLMQVSLAAALVSLVGVALGGGLTFFSQRQTLRSTRALEDLRQNRQRLEARRLERIGAIEKFLISAQDAERVAVNCHDNGESGPEWRKAADQATDSLWIGQKRIEVLCSHELHKAAEAFASASVDAIWKKPPHVKVWDFLQPTRARFLQTARAELGEDGASPQP